MDKRIILPGCTTMVCGTGASIIIAFLIMAAGKPMKQNMGLQDRIKKRG
jgi:hypothetical protein